MDASPPYLILGIGNSLLSDDGVGVHAAHRLEADPPPQTTVVAIETDFLSAIPFLERCAEVLVIDAMDAGGPPGTLYRCGGADLRASGPNHSLHALSLLEALEFVDAERRPRVHILGVQPGRVEPSLQLSPDVARALPRLVRAARDIIDALARETGPFSRGDSHP